MQYVFGTRTAADINLIVQIILIAGLWYGFTLPRRERIDGTFGHANVQTTMVLLNLIFIIFVMATSFYGYVVLSGTGDSVARWMIVHAILGILAELSGLYLIVRMRTNWLPVSWRIGNFRALMRATLGLWTLLVLLGLVVFIDRYYAVEFRFAITAPHGATAAPLLQMNQAGNDLTIHARELRDAVQEKKLDLTKRHAEHLVNLIEGNKGLRYGDVDINGHVEDPGDGTGLLAYVRQVVDAADEGQLASQGDQVIAQLTVIRDNAMEMAIANDLAPADKLIAETYSLASRADAEGIGNLNAAAQVAGVLPLPYTEPPAPGSPAPEVLTIIEENYAFLPYEVTISPGTTVVWINKERAKHTATSDVDGLFDSGDQDIEDAYEFTFTEPGDYPYFCRYHGDRGLLGMAGIIHVSDE